MFPIIYVFFSLFAEILFIQFDQQTQFREAGAYKMLSSIVWNSTNRQYPSWKLFWRNQTMGRITKL